MSFSSFTRIALALLAIPFLSACNPEDGIVVPTCLMKRTTMYTVSTGEHYFEPRCQALLRPSRIDFRAKLHGSTSYDDAALSDDQGVNKLYGYSDCGKGHSEESARFGWMMTDGRMEIIPFVHRGGEQDFRENGKIGVLAGIELDRWYTYHIESVGDTYRFTIEAEDSPLKDSDGSTLSERKLTMVKKRGCSDTSASKYLLAPYFGGTSTAPHPMQIEIEVL